MSPRERLAALEARLRAAAGDPDRVVIVRVVSGRRGAPRYTDDDISGLRIEGRVTSRGAGEGLCALAERVRADRRGIRFAIAVYA